MLTELEACKRETMIIKSERDTVEQIGYEKSAEVQYILGQELNLLDEKIQKHLIKQKAENSRFQAQIGHIKEMKSELDQEGELVSYKISILENHLGIDALTTNQRQNNPTSYQQMDGGDITSHYNGGGVSTASAMNNSQN